MRKDVNAGGPNSVTMNFLSLNIRGRGSRIKRKRINFIINSGKVDLCFLLEIKFNHGDTSVFKELWGRNEMEWTSFIFVGASGGLLILWRKSLFKLLFSFKGHGFMGIHVEFKGGMY